MVAMVMVMAAVVMARSVGALAERRGGGMPKFE
jgi:hypothetical protein